MIPDRRARLAYPSRNVLGSEGRWLGSPAHHLKQRGEPRPSLLGRVSQRVQLPGPVLQRRDVVRAAESNGTNGSDLRRRAA